MENYIEKKQKIQNKVDYRDASSVGIKKIKDDKIFEHPTYLSSQGKLFSTGMDMEAQKVFGKSWWDKIKYGFNRVKLLAVQHLPSAKVDKGLIDNNVPGASKWESVVQSLSFDGSVDRLNQHKNSYNSKVAIITDLTLHNQFLETHKHTNTPLTLRGELVNRAMSLTREVKTNYEYYYGCRNDKHYTYLDDPMLKVIDDAYKHRDKHNQPVLTQDSYALAKYVIKDQWDNRYDVNLQHNWNKRYGIYVKNRPNISISYYLGISDKMSQQRKKDMQNKFNHRPITQSINHNQSQAKSQQSNIDHKHNFNPSLSQSQQKQINQRKHDTPSR